MTINEKRPASDRDHADQSKDQSSKPTTGTESELKGGQEAAKRQAERDWENSSKEAGE